MSKNIDDRVYKIEAEEVASKGIANFRDIGGMQANNGRTTKYGRIYRSAQLTGITPEGKSFFKEIGLKTICDLRTEKEAESQYQEILSGVRYFNIPLLEEVDDVFDKGILKDRDKIINHWKESYINSAINNNITKLFRILTDEASYPILLHCAGGKDRTGVAIALLLTALGVPKQSIIQDYLLTRNMVDQFLREFKHHLMKEQTDIYEKENIEAFMYPQEEYLNAVFEEIEKRFGSMEDYYDHYGFTMEKRKKLEKILLSEV